VSDFLAYGTLSIPEVRATVLGRRHEDVPARAAGFKRVRMRNRVYPAAVEAPGAWLEGRLYLGLDAAMLARIDRFEGRQYVRRRIEVEAAGATRPADLYVLRDTYRATATDDPWDMETFVREHLPAFLRMCAEFRAEEEARAAQRG
jgi:gamma-glutamylcyclotransferase (GGCT)/AIG2-like uncharacterized protein YtfP